MRQRANKMKRAVTTGFIDKAHQLSDTMLLTQKVDDSVELWVKMKLVAWDKDQSGSFTTEEVEDAMDELRETEAKMANLKWQFIGLFSFMFIFVAFMGGTAWIAMTVMKTTEVPESGSLRAVNPNSKKPKLTELVTTTESSDELSLLNILDFDTTTDQWMIDESMLREMDKVKFLDAQGTYYGFEVAELIRVDSGKNGTNDKLLITAAGGTQLRVWESVGELEVKWPNSTMWEGVPRVNSTSGGRLLSSEDEEKIPGFLEDEMMLSEGADGDEHRVPSRRLGKGGFVFVGVHHRSHGGGGGCNGYCSVPYGATDSCRQWCSEMACYNWGATTYQCRGGAAFFGPQWLLQALAALLVIGMATESL